MIEIFFHVVRVIHCELYNMSHMLHMICIWLISEERSALLVTERSQNSVPSFIHAGIEIFRVNLFSSSIFMKIDGQKGAKCLEDRPDL